MRSRGQIIVLFTLLLPVMLGAMALAVDIGVFYFEWAQLQKAADAAVLAGASYLPQNPTQAISTANSYAQMNGVAKGEIASTTVGASNQTISIKLSRDVCYYFGAVLGLTQSPVAVAATAGLLTTGSASGVLPLGIDSRTNYTYGAPISLFQGNSPPGTWGPGNWGALALGGSGACNFENNVVNGYDGTVSVGDVLATETGQMTGPVRSSFDTRISAGEAMDPGGTWSSHSLADPRAVTVPIVDFADINGVSQVPVLGFAEVWLAGVDNKLDISAIFLQQVSPGGEPDPNATNYGAYKAVLLQ
jgi:Putative Flp pilus-assembly TadE/G-like